MGEYLKVCICTKFKSGLHFCELIKLPIKLMGLIVSLIQSGMRLFLIIALI